MLQLTVESTKSGESSNVWRTSSAVSITSGSAFTLAVRDLEISFVYYKIFKIRDENCNLHTVEEPQW